MLVFISLAATANAALRRETYGPVQIEIKFDKVGNVYSLTWTNKMTNVQTKLIKLGKDAFMVENKAPKTPLVSYPYKDVREACMTFFMNADIRRLKEDLVFTCRKFVADQVKAFEGKKMLNINVKNITYAREHRAMNTPVLVGPNREQQGIMVGLNWAGTRAKVAMFDENNMPTRVVEFDTSLVWIE